MTLSTTSNKVSFSGNGSTTVFAYNFKILANSDLKVYIRSATGTETLKTISTHYNVSGVGSASGGNVTFTGGNTPTNTETVIIQRVVPLTQTHDYVENDPFPAESHEEGLDRLTMHVQQIKEEVDRSIKASVTNTITTTEFADSATDRANKLFGFDSNGNLSISTTLGTNRGNWAASTVYSERDIVKDTSTNNIFQINSGHTSSGSQPLTSNANSAKYTLLVDAATATTAAATATTKAAEASTSATASATSATASASSATAAAASFDSFDDKYLGAKSSAPSTDNDGDALANGALYWNTSSNLMYAWNGSAWVALADAASVASSAATATTKAGEAATSATASASSATAAASSATTASGHKDTATTKAGEAATSASTASGHKDTATTKASEAAASATAAASSATAGASSASSASSSATSAAASFDSFDDRYLGAKGSAPSVDNDGNTLITGALYFNSSSNQLFVRSSNNTWVESSFSASGFMSKASNLGDVTSASTSRSNLGLGTAATLTAGTGANNVVQLDGSSKLPAVDGSALTNLPASSGTVNKVADGAIAIRKPVVLTAAGKAKEVALPTISSGTGTLSTNTVSNAEEGQVAMGATNQFVNLYRVANTTNMYLTPNTISSTDLKTITRGTTVNFDAGKERNAGIIYEPNQDKYVVIALNSNDYLTATTATFSGTGSSATLTLGTQTVIDSNAWSGSGFQNANITYDTTAQKIIVSGIKSGTNNAVCIVINLDGTTFTQGSRTTVTIATPSEYASDNVICAYSSTENRVVFLYCENSQSDSTADIYTTVGTVSGTSISFGSAQAVGNRVDTGYGNMSLDTTLSVDNNGVIVITYLSQSYALYSQSATLSNTTLTWGSTSQISNITVLNGAFGECGSVKIASGKTVIVRATTSGSASNADKGIFCVITVSGTSVTNGSVQEFSSSATRYPNVSSNYSKTQALINFGSGSENNIIHQLDAQSGSTSNLTTSNYLGISAEAISDTATGKININGGISEGHSSLAIGTNYFATDAGAIATSGTQLIGKALSATEIQLGVKSGTAAHNTVTLDANAKIPAVDGSQLTNLPAPSDARIFCGSYDFRVDGSSTAQNVLISLPSGYTAANVRAYEINYYGVGFAASGNHFTFKPYNGSSSILSGNNVKMSIFSAYDSSDRIQTSKTVSAGFPLQRGDGGARAAFSGNDVDNPKQNYNNTSGHGGQLNGRAIYTNSLKNGSYDYSSTWRWSSSDTSHAFARGVVSSGTTNSTTNYADGFYFYIADDSQNAQSTAIMEGVVSVYAIIG
jgi:hypothetical protein